MINLSMRISKYITQSVYADLTFTIKVGGPLFSDIAEKMIQMLIWSL